MTVEYDPHRVEWTPEKVGRFWNYLGRHHAGEFFSEKHGHDLVDRLLREARPKEVVDVGCGTGPLVVELARRGIRSIGIDTSADVLAVARERAAAVAATPEFHLGSGVDIPLPDAAVDAATLIEVVEHLDDEVLGLTLAEVRRVLRPGGKLMITTPNNEDIAAASRQCPDCGAEFHVFQHVRSWTMASLAATLRAAGFDSADVRPAMFVEMGRPMERLVPIAFRILGRPLPRLLAFATKAERSRG